MGLIGTVKAGIGAVVGAVNIFKTAKSEFEILKDVVLKHNSTADQALQAKEPLPAPSEPDYKQILAYAKRAFALALEMGQAVAAQLTEKGSK